MKLQVEAVIFICLFVICGCETAHKATTTVGKPIGQAADVFGGVTEGAAEGMQGEITSEENPYER